MARISSIAVLALVAVVSANFLPAAELGLKTGSPTIQSAGALAFGPDGILFVGDAKAATIVAIDTASMSGDPAKVSLKVEGVEKQLAAALKANAVTINDMAVNPVNGDVFFSLTRDGNAALARLTPDGKFSEFSTKDVKYSQVTLPNPPEDKITGEGRRRRNRRMESITDLAYVEGKLVVAGLSSEEAPSTVREIEFPFNNANSGVNLEIFHAAHGRTENYAAVRTFVPFNIDGEPSILAGFTCTPLVKFPIKDLTGGKKIEGTTVAELGNRNRPLDMIVYEKNGKHFLLAANSARGVMKISTEGIGKNPGLKEPVRGGGTAGQEYETIESLEGVVQLDRLNDTHAIVVSQTDGGSLNLATIELP